MYKLYRHGTLSCLGGKDKQKEENTPQYVRDFKLVEWGHQVHGVHRTRRQETKKSSLFEQEGFAHGKNGNPTSVEALYAYGVSQKNMSF